MSRTRFLAAAIVAAMLQASPAQAAGELATAPVQASGAADSTGFDGVVEAVRQTVVAAQVPGAVVEIAVKAGDTVRAGQVLLRIDARAAAQNSAASEAQVQAARSQMEVATREFERQRQLYQKQYISLGALERAEAQFKATSAQVQAQLAQANASRIEAGFYVVKAPYAGIVSEVPVMQGDMAMPGRPLLTLYDPAALRVAAAVPQTAIARMLPNQPARIELPGMPAARQWPAAARTQVLPTIDAATHTAQVRVDLAASPKDIAPGTFARVWLPLQGAAAGRLFVPAAAVTRRAELSGVYVVDAGGKPQLRQVRLGRASGESVEVLSGLAPGEKVALDPQAAARVR
jgi:multidrug efflux system membrane fusion protein